MQHNLDNATLYDYFAELGKLVAPEPWDTSVAELIEMHRRLGALNWTSEDLMFELMQPCDVMITNCLWLGKPKPCQQLFRAAKSTEGYCCSFNYKAPLGLLEL